MRMFRWTCVVAVAFLLNSRALIRGDQCWDKDDTIGDVCMQCTYVSATKTIKCDTWLNVTFCSPMEFGYRLCGELALTCSGNQMKYDNWDDCDQNTGGTADGPCAIQTSVATVLQICPPL